MFDIVSFIAKNKVFFIILLGILGLYYFVQAVWSILSPFMLGFVLAYMFEPLIHYLHTKYNISRALLSIITVVIVVLIMLGVVVFIVPFVIYEIIQLVHTLFLFFQNKDMIKWEKIVLPYFSIEPKVATQYLNQYSNQLLSLLSTGFQNMASGIFNFVSSFVLLLITPFPFYYFLKDWKKITKWMAIQLHLQEEKLLYAFLTNSNFRLKKYIWGVFLDCSVLFVFYTVALGIYGVNFFFVLGLLSGYLNFIPYVGPVLMFCVVALVAFNQVGSVVSLIVVACIYLVAAGLDAYILQPYLVGKQAGIPPLVVIFALLAGGTMFGLMGIILAIPVASIIMIFFAFILRIINPKVYTTHNTTDLL